MVLLDIRAVSVMHTLYVSDSRGSCLYPDYVHLIRGAGYRGEFTEYNLFVAELYPQHNRHIWAGKLLKSQFSQHSSVFFFFVFFLFFIYLFFFFVFVFVLFFVG